MMVRRVSRMVGLLAAVVVLGCGSGARVAALRTNYPYVKDAVVQFVPVAGHRLRVITVGSGPPLLLLHTLRTQADYFGRLVPYLVDDWTVTIVDLPGHGFSDAPDVEYDQGFFTDAIRELMQIRDMRNVVIAGESIGASIALALAAEQGWRVRSVVALNTYDYVDGGAGGAGRASPMAHVYFHALEWPVVGWIAARIEPRFALQKILRSGFSDKTAFPDQYMNVLYDVGIEPHVISSIEREHESWARARAQYPRIRVPVHLVYGIQDWSRTGDRNANARAIPTARLSTIHDAGHFSSLEKPAVVAEVIQAERAAVPLAAAAGPAPEIDREQSQFHPYVLAPALVAESFLPSRNTTWWGGGLQAVLYGWSDNNERPGPGQGAIFTQFSVLGRSGSDDHLFLMRAGATLSFERNAARRWLIPYYGFAAGAMHEDRGTRGLVEASVGAYLLHSRHLVVAVDGGYLLPFSQIDDLAGFRMQLNVTLIPW